MKHACICSGVEDVGMRKAHERFEDPLRMAFSTVFMTSVQHYIYGTVDP